MTTKKRPVSIMVGLSIIALTISACNFGINLGAPEVTPQTGQDMPDSVVPEVVLPTATAEATTASIEIEGSTDLVDALKAAGAQVEPAGKIEQPFLEEYNVNGQTIKVNGVDVQVFELTNEIMRRIVSSQISSDGSSIAGTVIDWLDQPNFWAEGCLIVLYVGTDAAMIDLISSVMGAPITTHE